MIFAAAAREHLYIAWLWWLAGLTLTSLTELYPVEEVFFNNYHPEGIARENRPKTSLFLWKSFN